MLVVLVTVIGLMLVSAGRRGPEDEFGAEVVEFLETPAYRPRLEILLAFVSLAFMLGGAELMVVSAVSRQAPRAGIGLCRSHTLVGIGTSAPLIASIQAARRAEHDLVVGNALGGNLSIARGGDALVGLLSRDEVSGVSGLALCMMVGVVFVSWLAMAPRSVRPLGGTPPLARVFDHASLHQPLTTRRRTQRRLLTTTTAGCARQTTSRCLFKVSDMRASSAGRTPSRGVLRIFSVCGVLQVHWRVARRPDALVSALSLS